MPKANKENVDLTTGPLKILHLVMAEHRPGKHKENKLHFHCQETEMIGNTQV